MNILILLMLLVSEILFAQDLTMITADYRCDENGGGIAVKFDSPDGVKIWQTELGAEIGIELSVKKFRQARCPGCFAFEAVLMDEIEVRGEVIGSLLTYQMYDPSTEEWETLLKNVECFSTTI